MDSEAGQQTWGWLLGDGEARGIALVFLFSGLIMVVDRAPRLHDALLPDRCPRSTRRRRAESRTTDAAAIGSAETEDRRRSGAARGSTAPRRCRRPAALTASLNSPACVGVGVARVGSCAPMLPSPRLRDRGSAASILRPDQVLDRPRRPRRLRARRRRVGGVPPAAAVVLAETTDDVAAVVRFAAARGSPSSPAAPAPGSPAARTRSRTRSSSRSSG